MKYSARIQGALFCEQMEYILLTCLIAVISHIIHQYLTKRIGVVNEYDSRKKACDIAVIGIVVSIGFLIVYFILTFTLLFFGV